MEDDCHNCAVRILLVSLTLILAIGSVVLTPANAQVTSHTERRTVLVVFLQFSDFHFANFGSVMDRFNGSRLMGSQLGLLVGLNDYYTHTSYGAFGISWNVSYLFLNDSSIGPLTLGRPIGYYATDKPGDPDPNSYNDFKDANYSTLASDAVQLLYGDNLTGSTGGFNRSQAWDAYIFVHPGHAQEITHNSSDIWSQGGATVRVTAFQRYIAYAIVSEDVQLGTLCHEYGHVLGLPDLYGYQYANETSSPSFDMYSLMANGGWNGGGEAPGYPLVMERLWMGWIKETRIVNLTGESTEFQINRAEYLDNQTGVYGVRVPIDAFSYYWLEYRQNGTGAGYDDQLPETGVLVTIVDDARVDPGYLKPHGIVRFINVTRDGQTFDDDINRVHIRVLSLNTTQAAVVVQRTPFAAQPASTNTIDWMPLAAAFVFVFLLGFAIGRRSSD